MQAIDLSPSRRPLAASIGALETSRDGASDVNDATAAAAALGLSQPAVSRAVSEPGKNAIPVRVCARVCMCVCASVQCLHPAGR